MDAYLIGGVALLVCALYLYISMKIQSSRASKYLSELKRSQDENTSAALKTKVDNLEVTKEAADAKMQKSIQEFRDYMSKSKPPTDG